MKIKGTSSYVIFDLENGYALKAQGEILSGSKFSVYRDTMKSWEPPHDKEPLLEEDIDKIIQEVNTITNENTVQIFFD